MYQDYPVSRELLHWETQSQTSLASDTGQNLIHHQDRGYTMLFFVRSRKKVENVTSPFMYLGSATFVTYQSECPIQMIWRLNNPMPAEIFEENRRGGLFLVESNSLWFDLHSSVPKIHSCFVLSYTVMANVSSTG
jgi:hypothetical protein